MEEQFVAHISDSGKLQSVAEHSLNTAAAAADFSIAELRQINYLCGLLHDIGKYSDEFQRRIRGENIRVEHSICGALEAAKLEGKGKPLTRLLQLCIAGHHSGIPDYGVKNNTADMPTLCGRLRRKPVDFSGYSSELNIKKIDPEPFTALLLKDSNNIPENVVEKFAFFVRYCFSCLTDADSLDTAKFRSEALPEPLRCSFEQCEASLDAKLRDFKAVTELQTARSRLQEQAFARIGTDANIYLMNMPTGSGKTLASMRCALKRVLASNGRLRRMGFSRCGG